MSYFAEKCKACLHLFDNTLNNIFTLSPTIVVALGGIISLIFHFEVNTRNMSMPGWPVSI